MRSPPHNRAVQIAAGYMRLEWKGKHGRWWARMPFGAATVHLAVSAWLTECVLFLHCMQRGMCLCRVRIVYYIMSLIGNREAFSHIERAFRRQGEFESSNEWFAT